jgi:hypothetical protein
MILASAREGGNEALETSAVVETAAGYELWKGGEIITDTLHP